MLPLLYIIFSLHLFPPTNVPTHALYLSVVEVEHTSLAKTGQVKVKVFQDDLQNILKNAYPKGNVRIGEQVYPKYQQQIQTYFSKHFICEINGMNQNLSLQNCKEEQDVYWLEFEFECPSKWEKMSVKADFFMELFPTQSNVIRIKNGDKQRFMRLTKGQVQDNTLF